MTGIISKFKFLSFFFFIFSLVLLINNDLQNFIFGNMLQTGEFILNRPLTHNVWIERFKYITIDMCFVFFFLTLLTVSYNKLFYSFYNEKLATVSIFIIFAAFTLITAVNHETWNDEICAWYLAKIHSISSLFHEMRYEGHFILWYLILMPFAKLGFPIITLNLISWIITVLTVLYILYKSPFTLPTKIAILFTNGFLYWYPVVSRCYVLIPPLLFLLASIYNKRNERPLIFGFILAILSNTHAYIEGFVGIISLFFLINDIIIPWNKYSENEKKHHILSLAIIATGVIIAALQVLPGLIIEDKSRLTSFQFHPQELMVFLTSSNIYILLMVLPQ